MTPSADEELFNFVSHKLDGVGLGKEREINPACSRSKRAHILQLESFGSVTENASPNQQAQQRHISIQQGFV
jgi:hypothetical protein